MQAPLACPSWQETHEVTRGNLLIIRGPNAGPAAARGHLRPVWCSHPDPVTRQILDPHSVWHFRSTCPQSWPRAPAASLIFPECPTLPGELQTHPHSSIHCPFGDFKPIKLEVRSVRSRACENPFPHPLPPSPTSNQHSGGEARLCPGERLCLWLTRFVP